MTRKELQEIIAEAKKGKQIAQTTLLNVLWDRVYYFVLQKVRNKTEAEDITIQTFTKVFSKLTLYNEDFEFSTWVHAIAYNTTVDSIRKKPELKISLSDEFSNIDLEAVTPTPEQNLILKQKTAALMKNIHQLPKTYREVIQLRYLEDKPYKEIAALLNLTLANVKVRVLRGRKLLEEALEDTEQ